MDINIKDKEIKDGLLSAFHEICPGALEIHMVLCAYASESTKIARVSIKTLCLKTGFSLGKVCSIIATMKAAEFIEVPLAGQQGKTQIYKIKI